MSLFALPFSYVKWHYTLGLKDLFHNWWSFVIFIPHFFSISFLFKTLITPFGRLDEEYKKGLDVESFFETLVANTLMRLVGLVVRLFIIVIGFVSLLLVIASGFLVLAFWFIAPVLVIALLIVGAFAINPRGLIL